ncbi:hypothetical protein HC251_17430 [Iamia sp. SCSIO 61187]|uniref:hypothetical protein n=1 Tax=Iamia sp. SCSIO 61187 TaxID=2722752 RepID=UPI001C62CB2B|nr:hypothetical protein [Iamia sp. SCSIO 61187]QYG94042.1 hypothetical protein HC251_17430 [Iamia sp. SCSIO 61187]
MTDIPAQLHQHRVYRNLHFGTAGAFIALQREKNQLLVDAGLRPYAVWAPALGGLHHITMTCDFPSLHDFQVQGASTGAIEGYGALNARQLELVIEGTARDEMVKLELGL